MLAAAAEGCPPGRRRRADRSADFEAESPAHATNVYPWMPDAAGEAESADQLGRVPQQTATTVVKTSSSLLLEAIVPPMIETQKNRLYL